MLPFSSKPRIATGYGTKRVAQAGSIPLERGTIPALDENGTPARGMLKKMLFKDQ